MEENNKFIVEKPGSYHFNQGIKLTSLEMGKFEQNKVGRKWNHICDVPARRGKENSHASVTLWGVLKPKYGEGLSIQEGLVQGVRNQLGKESTLLTEGGPVWGISAEQRCRGVA